MFKINLMDNDLADVRKKDRFDEIVVRVLTVDEPRQLGDAKISFFKFIVDNGKNLRIQCIAVEDQIERIKPLVKENTIIRIRGATSKRERDPVFNGGDVPFVLMIYSNTKITVIEDSVSDDETEDDPVQKNRDMSLSALVSRFQLEHCATGHE